ncbi:hypothetical protein FAI40_08255 [Acetobacteraceae bacterium]|nr:hypothetical protein FAI40_08255 [Acetobacteraceae bacterium]
MKRFTLITSALLFLGSSLSFSYLNKAVAAPVPNVNPLACMAIMCLYGRHHYSGESHITGGQQPLCQPATHAYFSIHRWSIWWLFSPGPPFYDPPWTAISRQRFLAECISADASSKDVLIALEVNAIYGTWYRDPGLL